MKTTSKFLLRLLAFVLIVSLLPTTALANTQKSIEPGKAVTGKLTKKHASVKYLVSTMPSSNSWGIRLKIKANGAKDYEIWLTQQIGDDSVGAETKDFTPRTENKYLKKTKTGFTFKSPITKYGIDQYLYTISIPEYFWEDVSSKATFSYTLELYQ